MPRIQGKNLVFCTPSARLDDATEITMINGTIYVACVGRTIECRVRDQIGDHAIEVPENGCAADIRRRIDSPGCRLAVRGTPLADGVLLASLLFAEAHILRIGDW
jgi:hypothetical protein